MIPMLKIIIYSLDLHYVDCSINHCSGNLGTHIFNVKIKADPAALIKLRTMLSYEFSTDFNTMSAALKFFGGVFDMINEDLEPYGVQLRADLSQLRLQNNLKIDDLMTKTSLTARTSFETEHTVLIFYNKSSDGNQYSTVRISKCTTFTGFETGNLRNLADTMKREIVRSISNNIYKIDNIVDDGFNTAICGAANRCASFEVGVKNVRHLVSESYVTGKGYRLREHDMYDDVESDADIYATQDYSNDDELYEDRKRGVIGLSKILT